MDSLRKAVILTLLQELNISRFSTIHDDGSVDVAGSVYIPRHYTTIPVQFREVAGDFDCSNGSLTSLSGSPLIVGGDFISSSCSNITSLVGAPKSVGGICAFDSTSITSLVGCPSFIGLRLYISNTDVNTLNGMPAVIGTCKSFNWIDCRATPNLNAILPLFRVKGMFGIVHEASSVFDRFYRPDGSGDIIACQDALIEAGFARYARMK